MPTSKPANSSHDADFAEPAALVRQKAGVTIASSLRFEEVSHRYGDNSTLDDVSLEVNPGEVLCLLGPSGSGKTTLLRLAAGLIQPSDGRIFINQGEVSNAKGVLPPEKRGVGLVFQEFALFPHMNIRKNVEFGLTQLGKLDRVEHANRMLETVGLAGKGELYPNSLSGGEQQRVALARALAPKPGILLMDEPFSGLDARLRDSVRDETLRLLRDTRSTVLMVTHDPEEALMIGDRIALMRDGKLVQIGDCDSLFNKPNCLFSARFFSELNVFKGVYDGKMIKSAIGEYKLPEAFSDSAIGSGFDICVRPTDFNVQQLDDETLGKPIEGVGQDAGQGNGEIFQAYLTSRRYVGGAEMLEAVLPGDDMIIHLRISSDLITGESKWVALKPKLEKVMIFKQ